MNRITGYLVLTTMLFLTSCSPNIFFPQKRGFETFKYHPTDGASILPRTDGYYVTHLDDQEGFLFFKEDGSCLIWLMGRKIQEEELDETALYICGTANGDNVISGTNFWGINKWGHYVITGDEVEIQYRLYFDSAYEYKLITLDGKLENDSTFTITDRDWRWTVTRKLEDPHSDNPNMEFRFVEKELELQDTGLKTKRWYKKNVWYNNQ